MTVVTPCAARRAMCSPLAVSPPSRSQSVTRERSSRTRSLCSSLIGSPPSPAIYWTKVDAAGSGSTGAGPEALGWRSARHVLIESRSLWLELHEVARSPRKLMARAVGEGLLGRGPRRRPPARPIVDPATGDARPLRGRAVDPNRGHAIGHERV